MGEIFLSYSRRDHDFADRLTGCLKNEGIHLLVDTEEIQGGDAWRPAIVRAIADCNAFLLVLSPQAVESKNVVKELSLASEKNRRIIPIICEQCDIPDDMQYQVGDLQRIDFWELGFDAALQRLLHTLHRGASADAIELSHSSSRRLPAVQAAAASASFPGAAFPQSTQQPAAPKLDAMLCGCWQVQVIVPGIGPTAQLWIEMFPNFTFNGQLIPTIGRNSLVNGIWQSTPLGQLIMRGQLTADWMITPYIVITQFNQVSPTALAGTSNTGEQVIWTKVS